MSAPETPGMSVVIPVFNAEHTLAEQLRAVIACTDGETEILVVDNRSTDGSASVAASFAADHPRLRVVRADDRAGEPYARNVGIANARSGLVAFCDSDDVVAATWANAIRDGLQHAEYVTGPCELDRLNPQWLAGVRGRRIFSEIPRTAGGVAFAHGCNIGIRKATAESIGGFDENVLIGCDIDFALRADRAGVQLQFCPEAVIHYRHRSGTRDRWHQAVAYGRAMHHVNTASGYDDSFRRRCIRQARRIGWLVKASFRLANREVRTRWMWTLALVVGEIRGGPN